jgi:plasmid stabilization system protein ParE
MTSKIYWTRQSQADLRAIRQFIARDAPATSWTTPRSEIAALPVTNKTGQPAFGRNQFHE